jgi:hypothetical protein
MLEIDWSSVMEKLWVGLFLAAAIGWLVWMGLSIADHERQLEIKHVAFMEECVKVHPDIDCQFMWAQMN